MKNWNFSVDPCSGESGWATDGYSNNLTCNCAYANNSICHVDRIVLRELGLPGVLPPELVKLPYLQEIHLSKNYLSGSIPKEWGSMQLVNIDLSGNRLSGRIPAEFGNITTLKILFLRSNNFSGVLPPQLGNMANLETLWISSNNFSGPLPETFAKLINLKVIRIDDNNFSGRIPNFIQNWTQLNVIRMEASGLEGPIPLGISLLPNISDMRISDLNGAEAGFPPLQNVINMKILILRSCNIVGEIPNYLGSNMTGLDLLDLSFNKLTGQVPSNLDRLSFVNFISLTGNALTGPVPGWMLTTDKRIDLSYNNFTLGRSGSSTCQQQNVNLFRSYSMGNNSSGRISCSNNSPCPQKSSSFHINCGGREVITNESITYEDDTDPAGASRFSQTQHNWAYSSTGVFMDSQTVINYIAMPTNISGLTMNNPELYMAARLSPLSLTYYGFCLLSGNYTVNLHFAEIMMTNDNTDRSLGRRIFDIYIQGELVLKDFNIEHEAGGVGKAIIKKLTAVVTGTTLEIRFYWAGKGSRWFPIEGIYGPLISAISVTPDFELVSEDGKNMSSGLVVGIVISVFSLIVMVMGVLWWKGCFVRKNEIDQDLRGNLQTGSLTLRQITAATKNFDPANKIGEGGFGPVFKGHLADGTIIAVKQLSSKSSQGNHEFVNEIGMISALQHPNLVKLYGCCIEGNQLLLVYEYMENNSLARALFGSEECQLKLDWPTRHKICVGIARGIAYLHEESKLKIVHRDIKASNVLLDKDLNPKVSDFGLAKLDEQEKSHISTRVAGTIGYIAPDYARNGHLTNKVDVYSFGVVALEIVSGKKITSILIEKSFHELAQVFQEQGDLMELVDPKLESNYVKEEVMRMINVARLCTKASSRLRPAMSSVVSMLEGRTDVPKFVSNSSISSDDGVLTMNQDQSTSDDQTASDLYPPDSQYWKDKELQSMLTEETQTGSSTSAAGLYLPDSQYLKDTEQSMRLLEENKIHTEDETLNCFNLTM